MVVRPEAPPLTVEHYKKRVYDRHGVKELWIVDPEPREVLVYRFESGSGETAERFYQSDTVTSPLLPGLVVALEEVFRQ
jgi:Uma2 family endonuclease